MMAVPSMLISKVVMIIRLVKLQKQYSGSRLMWSFWDQDKLNGNIKQMNLIHTLPKNRELELLNLVQLDHIKR
jgi:hypothetical protein